MKKIYDLLTAATLVIAVIALAVLRPVSLGTVQSFCEQLAVISAGLQQPPQAILALREEHRGADPSIPTTTTTTTTSTAPSPTRPTNAPAPPRSQNGGQVMEETLSAGTPAVGKVAWVNRSGSDPDIAALFREKPGFALVDTDEPQVLIVHTHTTESYLPYYAGYYNDADVARTKDNTKNVVAVGEVMAACLRQAGIGVLHDTTLHDSPQYTGAYERSSVTVQEILKKHPSIKVVLDIHRDAIMPDDTTKVKPTVEIDGQKAAQVMIIAGAVDSEEAPHPHWKENMRLALQLQQALATAYPGLARPLSVVASRYNQHLAPGALLIEVGADANTVAEATYAGKLVSRQLAAVLQKLQEDAE